MGGGGGRGCTHEGRGIIRFFARRSNLTVDRASLSRRSIGRRYVMILLLVSVAKYTLCSLNMVSYMWSDCCRTRRGGGGDGGASSSVACLSCCLPKSFDH